LRLSTAERDRLVALRTGSVPLEGADDAMLRRFLADTPADVLIGRLWLSGGDGRLRVRLGALPVPTFPLHGRDLRAAGVLAGPRLGEMLRDVRAWWIAGGCIADRTACLAELARRLGK
jgi:hypothetical protein